MVEEDDDILLISDDGTIIRTGAGGVSVISRATQGVKVMTVAEGVKVIGLAVADPDEEEPSDESEAGESAEQNEAE